MKLILAGVLAGVFLFGHLTSCGKPGGGGGSGGNGQIQIELEEGNDLCGIIVDDSKAPIEGVVVSDGFQCVVTDEKGVYQMKRHKDAAHVFFTVPAEYRIPLSGSKYPMFFAKINATSGKVFRRDFSLVKAQKESKFSLICIGDPQLRTTGQAIPHYYEEILPAIKKTIEESKNPSYILTLGDITHENPTLLGQFKTNMGSLNTPYYVTPGNHDKVRAAQEYITESFKDMFGPLYYSFDRGDVHIICLDNVVFPNITQNIVAVTDEQLEWLRQDLSYVDKSKMLVVFYHQPIRGSTEGNISELINMVKDYAEVHFMCGHTHYHKNIINSSARGGIFEHIHATANGGHTTVPYIHDDGVPSGYAVYEVSGPTMANWYYKGGPHKKEFQIRLHKGNDKCGGSGGYVSYSQINTSFDANTVIANVFNADPEWEVRLFENGKDMGVMTRISATNDMWSIGYRVGIMGSNYETLSKVSCDHLYWKQRSGSGVADADIKVVATDRFGNAYEQTMFTAQDDFSQAIAPTYE